MSVLDEIQKWYASNCNGDWEHSFGIKVETLDNPGWSVKIDLEETNLCNVAFEKLENRLSEENWVHCRVDDNTFLGYGDETKLEEILKIFLDWAKLQNKNWLQPPSEEEIESREDAAFIDLLGDETGTETCKTDGCERKRVRFSVLCRKHHFENIKKRPFPETDS